MRGAAHTWLLCEPYQAELATTPNRRRVGSRAPDLNYKAELSAANIAFDIKVSA